MVMTTTRTMHVDDCLDHPWSVVPALVVTIPRRGTIWYVVPTPTRMVVVVVVVRAAAAAFALVQWRKPRCCSPPRT